MYDLYSHMFTYLKVLIILYIYLKLLTKRRSYVETEVFLHNVNAGK